MGQDQLTRRERIRLESFAQAQSSMSFTATKKPTLADLFEQAEEIERWLLNANQTGDA